jgi:hypothetical protein
MKKNEEIMIKNKMMKNNGKEMKKLWKIIIMKNYEKIKKS